MGILTASRRAAGAGLPVEVFGDDPSWTVEAAEAHWEVVLDEQVPCLPWSEEDVADLPLTRRGQVAELRRLAVEQARAAAREAALLVAVTGAQPRSREVSITDPDGGRPRAFTIVDEVLEEVSVALRRSLGTVRREVATARLLTMLPRTSAALESGQISAAHAEVIARIADGLPARVLARYERQVVAKAQVGTPGETASYARRRACQVPCVSGIWRSGF